MCCLREGGDSSSLFLAVQVWNHIRLYASPAAIEPPAHAHNRRDLLNWLLEWLSLVKHSELDLTMMALYQIWLSRNDARDSHRIEDPACVAKCSINLTEE